MITFTADQARSISNANVPLASIEGDIAQKIVEAAKKGLKEVKSPYESYESKVDLIKDSLKQAGYKYEEDTWFDQSICMPVETKKLIVSWQ